MSAEEASAADIIRLLELQPHPEGGYFREMFRDPCQMEGRSVSTAIYYLLKKGERSHWHRVDAAEVWHYYAGAPLALHIAESEKSKPSTNVLGKNIAAGERPQIVVTEGHWQAAETLGDWTLVGCTVAPGFELSGFELARKDWSPGA
jgi:predicted cupin superfamily sugar epimerase